MIPNRELLVFSGRSNPKFSASICENLQIEQGKLEVIRYSDGELSVEIGDNVRGRDVFVVQSTSTPVNEYLMELLIVADALKRASAWRVTAVMPYFGYARQDRKLKPRVPITAKLVADVLQVAGIKRILTMDLHAGQIMGFFDIPVDNLNALPVFAPYIMEKYGTGQEITVVSPDTGGVVRARQYATTLDNATIAIIDKRRGKPNQIAEMHVVGEVKDKVCILVDDMIDTAGTITKACETLLEEGAKKVIACSCHAVLSGQAIERLERSSIEEVIVADTILLSKSTLIDKIKVISVASLFAEAIKRIYHEDSVSSLFTKLSSKINL